MHQPCKEIDRWTGIILFTACTGLLLGCGVRQEKQEAEARVAAYYRDFADRDVDALLAQYSDSFYTATSTQEWRGTLAALLETLGPYQEHRILSFDFEQREGKEPGDYVRLRVLAEYEYTDTEEKMLLVKPPGAEDYRIQQHLVESEFYLTDPLDLENAPPGTATNISITIPADTDAVAP